MSVTENELIIADDDLIISDGETSSCLLIQNGNYVTVESGGTLTDSLLTDVNTMVFVEEGGIVKDVSATDNSWLYVCGSGTNLTAGPEQCGRQRLFQRVRHGRHCYERQIGDNRWNGEKHNRSG